MNKFICIHGHFYQPPRENPWLEAVELQESAHPYHDWNEKINSECYAPNTAARILDEKKLIVGIVNNYRDLSFNVAPTLLSWMEQKAPETYREILEADRISRTRFSGHGAAIAQGYSHLIMPLANVRDQRTQVVWGLKDFERRFGRPPEGMWLAETAVDLAALEVMAEQGIEFTILAPSQAGRVRRIGEKKWRDVSGEAVNPATPYLCPLPSGKSIAIFFYNGPISREVAFGNLLNSGEAFARRLIGAFGDSGAGPQLVHIATDGETYGHHHRFGDMALAYCLKHIEQNQLARITVYGEYLEKHPPVWEAEILENTSWSCTHGLERWRSDCGCETGGGPGWHQAWRAPLREALDRLRDTLAPAYRRAAGKLLKDPWAARDDYIEVILDRSSASVNRFLKRWEVKGLSPEEKSAALKLLEMQRHALLMYTSCGWFFSDISGIETRQVLAFAARAIQLGRESAGVDAEDDFVKALARAPSNLPGFKDGARIYENLIRPSVVDLMRVGANYAISSLFMESPPAYCYAVQRKEYECEEAGKQQLALGRVRVRSTVDWEERELGFAVLHFGDHNCIARVKEGMKAGAYSRMREQIRGAFSTGHIPEVIGFIDGAFGSRRYTLRDLFKDEQQGVLRQVLGSTLAELETSLHQIYRHHQPVMRMLKQVGIPLPKVLTTMLEFLLDKDVREALAADRLDLKRLRDLGEERKEWSLKVDRAGLGYLLTRRINEWMEKQAGDPENPTLCGAIEDALAIPDFLPIDLNLWKAQNIFFSLNQKLFGPMSRRARKGDAEAREWLNCFQAMGEHLCVKVGKRRSPGSG